MLLSVRFRAFPSRVSSPACRVFCKIHFVSPEGFLLLRHVGFFLLFLSFLRDNRRQRKWHGVVTANETVDTTRVLALEKSCHSCTHSRARNSRGRSAGGFEETAKCNCRLASRIVLHAPPPHTNENLRRDGTRVAFSSPFSLSHGTTWRPAATDCYFYYCNVKRMFPRENENV